MEDALTGLLITAIIIVIILGIVYVILKEIASKFAFGNIVMMIFYGLAAIIVLLKIVVPLLGML